MTSREHVNRAKRRSCTISIPGFLLVLLASQLGADRDVSKYLFIIGFAACFIGIISMFISGKCVHCERNLGVVSNQTGCAPWKLSSDFKFCPYCGLALDLAQTAKGDHQISS